MTTEKQLETKYNNVRDNQQDLMSMCRDLIVENKTLRSEVKAKDKKMLKLADELSERTRCFMIQLAGRKFDWRTQQYLDLVREARNGYENFVRPG